MEITRRSILSGITRTLDLDITEEQVLTHKNGGLIQNVMSNLSEWEREFYINGTTQQEWDDLDDGLYEDW